jgi:hypothetical protein
MSLCQSETDEMSMESISELRKSRLEDLSSEIKGQLRAFILPLAMIPSDSIFAPVDAMLGIDRRQVIKQGLLDIIEILDTKPEGNNDARGL